MTFQHALGGSRHHAKRGRSLDEQNDVVHPRLYVPGVAPVAGVLPGLGTAREALGFRGETSAEGDMTDLFWRSDRNLEDHPSAGNFSGKVPQVARTAAPAVVERLEGIMS